MYEKASSLSLSVCPSSFAPTSGKGSLLSPLSTLFVGCLPSQATHMNCPDFFHKRRKSGLASSSHPPLEMGLKNWVSPAQSCSSLLGLPADGCACCIPAGFPVLVVLLPSLTCQDFTSPRIVSVSLPCAHNEEWQRAGGPGWQLWLSQFCTDPAMH